MKKNIAIVMGGYSSEVNISLKSGNVVYNHLDREIARFSFYIFVCIKILKNECFKIYKK